MDIGASLEVVLTDGRTVGGQLTFGDVARAELQHKTNYMHKFRNREEVTLVDLAQLTFQIARRTGGFTGTWDEWLMVLDTFNIPNVDDDDTTTEVANTDNEPVGAPVPFPKGLAAGC